MTHTRIVAIIATHFIASAFVEEGKRKFFNGIEVRHNGQEEFIFYPCKDGSEVKVFEDQWIVEENDKISVWTDKEFKKTFTEVEEKAPVKAKAPVKELPKISGKKAAAKPAEQTPPPPPPPPPADKSGEGKTGEGDASKEPAK